MLSKIIVLLVVLTTFTSCSPVLAQQTSTQIPNYIYVGTVWTQANTFDVRLEIYSHTVQFVINGTRFTQILVKETGFHSYSLSFKDGTNDVIITLTFNPDYTASGGIDIYNNGSFAYGSIHLVDTLAVQQ